jgi:surface protein
MRSSRVDSSFTPEDNNELRDAVSMYKINREQGVYQYGPMSSWNTINITDMSGLFNGYTFRNDEMDTVTYWNTSNVENMNATFQSCETFDQVLNWDTSSVIEMEYMFDGCISFNSPFGEDFNENTVNLESMTGMFNDCPSFDQTININTANVNDMEKLFRNCTRFNSPFGDNFVTDQVTNMMEMFYNCSSFNQPLDFDTSNVQHMGYMFSGCSVFNPPDLPVSRIYEPMNISNWDVRNVIDMRNMFENCRMFNKPLSNWDPFNVVDTSRMFSGCHAFNQSLANWVLDMRTRDEYGIRVSDTMFYDCRSFNPDFAPVYPDGKKIIKYYITYDEIIEDELPELEQSDTIQIRDTDTVFDIIEGTEINLLEKINDINFVVFYFNNHFYLFDRNQLDTNCKDPEFVKYACNQIYQVLHVSPNMYDGTYPYLIGNIIGIPVGFIPLDQLKKVVYSRYPIIRIDRQDENEIPTTVSLNVIMYGDASSASHCQKDHGGRVGNLTYCNYELYRGGRKTRGRRSGGRKSRGRRRR